MANFSKRLELQATWGLVCCLSLLALAAGCRSGPPQFPEPTSVAFELETDSVFFATVVSTMRSENGFSVLRVQPYPLPAGPGYTFPLLSQDSAVRRLVHARRVTLSALRVRTIRDATTGNCPTGSVIVGTKVNCPKSRELRISVGPPRRGGAYLPSTGIDDRESGAQAGRQVVRVVVWDFGPGSKGSAAWDFVFEPSGTEWRLVDRVKVEHVD
jgi:hypothetical protein